jgi:disulfide bond formation protein DsbB
MLERLDRLVTAPWYWIALVALGMGMETLALVYEYALDYWPCVLCIHVRVWVLAFTLVALLALPLRRRWQGRAVAHALLAGIMAAMLERAWQLFATERGFAAGSCDFDAGLPVWLPLDSWFPLLFEIRDACGYTPVLAFGVTMAEALLVFAGSMLLLSVLLLTASLSGRRR